MLVKDPLLSRALVIINEFGAIGLDHLLVEKVDGDMLLMSSGCLCCTIRGDLVSTFEDVMRRLDNGRMAPIGRVLIETTGLADPAPILHTLMSHPYLALRLRLDGVITLVDAIHGFATLEAHGEALKQVAVADRLVLTKTDMVKSAVEFERLHRLRERLAALNPAAPIFDAAAGEATAERLLDAGVYDPTTKSAHVHDWLRWEAYANVGKHREHAHDANRHGDDIVAFGLTAARPLPDAGFKLFIEMVRQTYGAQLLRVKGLVCLDSDPSRPLLVHGVQHLFYPAQRLANWPDDDCSTRVVFITKGLAPSCVEGLWRAFLGEPGIDTPDAAALSDNPLAPRADRGLLG